MKPDITSLFVVPVTVRPHRPIRKGKRETTGHHISIMQVFIPSGGKDFDPAQFLGFHPRSLILTAVRPPHIQSIADLVREMPTLPGRGIVHWLGAVRCYRVGNGIRVYVPNRIWCPAGPDFDRIWRDIGTAYWWARAASAEPFFLIDLPSIRRETK